MAQKTPASQAFVPIKEIRDNVVILQNGQMCGILLTTSINLALKAQDEQRAILEQFQAFLNSLDFSLQIYAQSRRYDVRPYLTYLHTLEETQHNELMRVQLREYTEFIRTFTEDVAIMKKNFFVVIPYNPALISQGKSFIPSSFQKSESNTVDAQFTASRAQLDQRVQTVSSGLMGMGIKSARLGRDELVELFYHIYNPGELGSAPRSNE
jgi:hypothetical protein